MIICPKIQESYKRERNALFLVFQPFCLLEAKGVTTSGCRGPCQLEHKQTPNGMGGRVGGEGVVLKTLFFFFGLFPM